MLSVSYNGGKNWKTVTLVNGKATLDISNDDGKVVFDYFGEENDNYEYKMVDYTPPTPSPVTPTNPDNTNPSGSGNSQGEKTEGNGTATNPSSGSSQPQSNVANSNTPIEDASSQSAESSSSQAASQAVSSDSASQSESKESVAKVLSIDEEVVRIAGLSFIVLLILAVIGLYYKDDVEYMLNKRNGH